MKIEASRAKANKKQYAGLGLVTPWILEPSHKSSVGQKTSMISGVPEPAKKRNDAERTARIEARRATLVLNQRFRSKMSKRPSTSPMTMLGSLTE